MTQIENADLFLQVTASDRGENLIEEIQQVVELISADSREVDHNDNHRDDDYARYHFHRRNGATNSTVYGRANTAATFSDSHPSQMSDINAPHTRR